jgi:hypothetical protein
MFASLAPLSMNVIGEDLNRWTSLGTTTSFSGICHRYLEL